MTLTRVAGSIQTVAALGDCAHTQGLGHLLYRLSKGRELSEVRLEARWITKCLVLGAVWFQCGGQGARGLAHALSRAAEGHADASQQDRQSLAERIRPHRRGVSRHLPVHTFTVYPCPIAVLHLSSFPWLS